MNVTGLFKHLDDHGVHSTWYPMKKESFTSISKLKDVAFIFIVLTHKKSKLLFQDDFHEV